MLCDPTLSAMRFRIAFPVLSRAVTPSAAVPSLKLIVPVGIPPLPWAVTAALKVTDWPKELGLGDAERVVVIGALLTAWETVADVEPEKLASPAYAALML